MTSVPAAAAAGGEHVAQSGAPRGETGKPARIFTPPI